MALADDLFVFWEPRWVVMQFSSQHIAQLGSTVFHYLAMLHCDAAGLDFVFHMFFLIKYSKSLEEGSFRGRSADFLWMLLIGQKKLGSCTLTKHTRDLCSYTSLSQTCCHMLTAVLWLCRRSSAHLLCPLRKHTVSWVVAHLHDGKKALQHPRTKVSSDNIIRLQTMSGMACRCMCGRGGISMSR